MYFYRNKGDWEVRLLYLLYLPFIIYDMIFALVSSATVKKMTLKNLSGLSQHIFIFHLHYILVTVGWL